MRWTHVWMRDGILPLNCKRLETRSTVKTRVSRVGQSPFPLASESVPLSPHENTTNIALSSNRSLIFLCCLIMLGMMQKGLHHARGVMPSAVAQAMATLVQGATCSAGGCAHGDTSTPERWQRALVGPWRGDPGTPWHCPHLLLAPFSPLLRPTKKQLEGEHSFLLYAVGLF